MSDTLSVSSRHALSGTALKYIACITMLLDHIGASCIEAAILWPALDSGALSADAIASAPLYWLDQVLRLTGRLAFPIFCFLLVEGFVHTHDLKKYIRRLFLFALVSEVPFDLAFFRSPLYLQHQNVYWTLALGVLAMTGIRHFEKPDGSFTWKGLLCAAGCALAAGILRTDYDVVGVLIICVLYLTRNNRKRQCIIGAVLFAYEITAPLAFVFIWFYNGERGRCSKALQKCFYWFYPVHIAILAVISNLLM